MSDLSPLQVRILEALVGLEPAWTLSGGGALVGFHLHHRTTRDLDLFLHGHRVLDDFAPKVIERLQEHGLEARSLRSARSHYQLQVADGRETILVDLVAEPVPTVEDPVSHELGAGRIQVDTEHEILVNKLCTLVQRSELRDLVDVRGLLAKGGDLARALVDAHRKDGGFSPMTVGWLLRGLEIETIGRAEGRSQDDIAGLVHFRDALLARIADLSRPGSD